MCFCDSLAIEFQYLQRQRQIEASIEAAGADENSVAAAVEAQHIVQRQPPPRRSVDLINSLSSLFKKSLLVT